MVESGPLGTGQSVSKALSLSLVLLTSCAGFLLGVCPDQEGLSTEDVGDTALPAISGLAMRGLMTRRKLLCALIYATTFWPLGLTRL